MTVSSMSSEGYAGTKDMHTIPHGLDYWGMSFTHYIVKINGDADLAKEILDGQFSVSSIKLDTNIH